MKIGDLRLKREEFNHGLTQIDTEEKRKNIPLAKTLRAQRTRKKN